MRPLTLATGFPVTIRSQGPGSKPTVVTNSPIQLVPLSSASGGMRGPGSQTTIRQVTPAKGTTIRQEYPPPVRVTVVQSPASISKVTTTQATGFYKPVTIASQAGRHIRPQAQLGGPSAQPLRIAAPTGPRMTVVSHQGQAHSINVALSPSHIQIPSQQQQPMARILTSGGSTTTTRFISMPTSQVSGGVTIQKALVTSAMPPGTKTISLPHSVSTAAVPKVVGTTAGIPVARVIPQLSNNPGDTNLYITRPIIQPMHYTHHEDGAPLLVTSMPTSSSATIQRSPIKQPGSYEGMPGASSISIPISPSRPGILRRREGEREPLLGI